MLKSFLKFISQGHAFQLAIGIIIAGAFEQIITSFVSNIFSPFIGWITGGVNLNNLVYNLGNNKLNYGLFIESIINFFIVGLSVFAFIKIYDHFQKSNLLKNIDLISKEPAEIAELTQTLKDIKQELHEIKLIQKNK